eukprot:5238764-Pleurochrysis_carterae.AAC.1
MELQEHEAEVEREPSDRARHLGEEPRVDRQDGAAVGGHVSQVEQARQPKQAGEAVFIGVGEQGERQGRDHVEEERAVRVAARDGTHGRVAQSPVGRARGKAEQVEQDVEGEHGGIGHREDAPGLAHGSWVKVWRHERPVEKRDEEGEHEEVAEHHQQPARLAQQGLRVGSEFERRTRARSHRTRTDSRARAEQRAEVASAERAHMTKSQLRRSVDSGRSTHRRPSVDSVSRPATLTAEPTGGLCAGRPLARQPLPPRRLFVPSADSVNRGQ